MITTLLKQISLCLLLFSYSSALLAEEKIIFSLPKWKVLSEESNEKLLEVIHEPESPLSDEIEERVFIRTLIGKTDSEAQAWMEKLRADRKSECDFFSLIEVPVMGADPAPAVGQVLYCGQEKESGKGVISMHRVTQGKENLYVIEKRWTTYPFDHPETAFVVREELMPWIRQMTRAYLCGSEEIPCSK